MTAMSENPAVVATKWVYWVPQPKSYLVVAERDEYNWDASPGWMTSRRLADEFRTVT